MSCASHNQYCVVLAARAPSSGSPLCKREACHRCTPMRSLYEGMWPSSVSVLPLVACASFWRVRSLHSHSGSGSSAWAMLVVPLLPASFKLHAVGHLPTPAAEMPLGVFLAITNLSSTTHGAVAIFGGIVDASGYSLFDWRHQARSSVQHFDEQFITGKCFWGKSKMQGQRRASAWRVPEKVGLCFSILDHVFVLLSTLYIKNPDLCSLVFDFESDTLSPSSNWLPKPMSYVQFMCTSGVSFDSLAWRPKDRGTRCQVQYIRRFLPTLGEVLRVDTTEAQSA